jgi:hypothetical protein
MRLRPWRRAAGPTAAHHSQYGPRRAPKITSIQRDAVYRQILDQMANAGDLRLLVAQGDLSAAGRLAREVSDDLQLVSEALGWRETSRGDGVELDLPPEQLRRTFARLLERAIEDREVSSQPAGAGVPYERALLVIETCDQVLAAVGEDTRRWDGDGTDPIDPL